MRPLESVRACRDAATGGIGDEFGVARLRGRIPTRRSRARTLTRVTWAKTGTHNPRAPAPGAPAGAGAVATARRRRAAAGSRGRRACGAAPAPVRRRAQGTRRVRGASESRPAGTAMPATPIVSMARGNARLGTQWHEGTIVARRGAEVRQGRRRCLAWLINGPVLYCVALLAVLYGKASGATFCYNCGVLYCVGQGAGTRQPIYCTAFRGGR